MSVSIPTEQIDVNVHPTKKNVIFERQDEFCEYLKTLLDEQLTMSSNDRSFLVDVRIHLNFYWILEHGSSQKILADEINLGVADSIISNALCAHSGVEWSPQKKLKCDEAG